MTFESQTQINIVLLSRDFPAGSSVMNKHHSFVISSTQLHKGN